MIKLLPKKMHVRLNLNLMYLGESERNARAYENITMDHDFSCTCSFRVRIGARSFFNTLVCSKRAQNVDPSKTVSARLSAYTISDSKMPDFIDFCHPQTPLL